MVGPVGYAAAHLSAGWCACMYMRRYIVVSGADNCLQWQKEQEVGDKFSPLSHSSASAPLKLDEELAGGGRGGGGLPHEHSQ